MLVHRMVKDIKNSKVLHKIKTKDAYTAQQLYQQFKSQHLLDDRREYDEEDLMSAYPGLSKEEAKKLFDMLQRSTDAADLSLSKDDLIDAMGSGYTPVHVQKNRQGVFIVFKSDKDGKFYIVEKRSKQLFSVATSLAMAKRIIGETEDSKSKDADPRGFKVNDQIIKGFMVYKMDKNPALFVAKNENGQQYEGSMEEIKRKIDAYWVKQDEDVMKQKVRDEKIPYVKSGTTRGYIIEIENDKNEVFPWKGYIVTQKGKYYICKEKTKQEAINECKKYIESRESEIKDSKTKDAGGFIGVATAKPGKYFTGYRTQEKSPLFDNEKDAKEWCRFRMQRSDAKHIAKCEVVPTNDSKTKDDQISEYAGWTLRHIDDTSAGSGNRWYRIQATKGKAILVAEGRDPKDVGEDIRRQIREKNSKTKDKAYHPRWRIKDDKLFRLRSAIKKAKVKDSTGNYTFL